MEKTQSTGVETSDTNLVIKFITSQVVANEYFKYTKPLLSALLYDTARKKVVEKIGEPKDEKSKNYFNNKIWEHLKPITKKLDAYERVTDNLVKHFEIDDKHSKLVGEITDKLITELEQLSV